MSPVADIQLAEQYGVPVSLVTSHREKVLTEGRHWQRDGKRVLWLADGLEAVAALVAGMDPAKNEGGGAAGDGVAGSGAGGEGEDSGAGKKEAGEGPAARRTAMARIYLKHPNPSWVRCYIPGTKEATFDVKIRNHHNVGQKAVLPVEQQEDGTWICTHPQHSPRRFQS